MNPEIPNLEQKEKIKIQNTSEFKAAVEKALESPENSKDLLCEAEKWLEDVKNNPENYPNYSPEKDGGRWLDHQEYTLFKAYRSQEDWDGANRIIESIKSTPHAEKNNSKQGRIDILSKEIETANQKS